MRALRTFVATPFASTSPEQHALRVAYARAAMLDSLALGEAPFLPHLLYPAVLCDGVEAQRETAMRAGKAWLEVAEVVAVYDDLGISAGMAIEIAFAGERGIAVEHRRVDPPTVAEIMRAYRDLQVRRDMVFERAGVALGVKDG